MKQLLLICAVVMVALVGLVVLWQKTAPKEEIGVKAQRITPNPNAEPPEAVIEFNIRMQVSTSSRLYAGELTKEHYEKVTVLLLPNIQLTSVKSLEKLTQLRVLDLNNNLLTSVKGLEKLTQLNGLELENNPDLTKAQIAELKKALPKCNIRSNPKK